MAKGTRTRTRVLVLSAVAPLAFTAACGGGGDDGGSDEGSGGDVTLEFSQWWEPELPEGSFRALMDRFEEENPGITVELLSGPYASTKEQVVAGAAAGTMSDVVGLDGAWVSDFVDQGSIADLSAIMGDAGYDDGQLASQVEVDGSTYMIPVVNFVYPMFTNDDLLTAAGVTAPPTTRTEFADAAGKVAAGGASGWILPLSLEAPNGIQNDVMSWVWASGGSMLDDEGQPDLTNDDVTQRGRVRQAAVGRRRRRAGCGDAQGAGQGRGVHERPSRDDDRLARPHQPHPRAQPGPQVQHRRHPRRGRLHRRARHAVRLLGHRHRREQRAQGGGLEARRVPHERGDQRRAVHDRQRLPRQLHRGPRTSSRATRSSRLRSTSTSRATRRTSSPGSRSPRT